MIMSLRNNLLGLFKGKHSIVDVWYYLQGNIRYRLYYSKFSFLIRKHVMEQINFRISVMNKECYDNGECIKCGCATTALQMCNKMCKGMCYPPMMWWHEWEAFKDGDVIDKKKIYWKLIDGKLYYGKQSNKLKEVCGNKKQ